MISAKIIKHSIDKYGVNIATMKLVFPRFILAELNTHRMFTKNSASSRAIPFSKMLDVVELNPFIPIAWQKHHSGMQGNEYLSKSDKYGLSTFIGTLIDTLQTFTKDSKDYEVLKAEIDEKVAMIENILLPYKFQEKTLDEWWLFARDKAIEAACIMYCFRVTKQLCNRLLEPFMWHSVILTTTDFENFFWQRCPRYYHSLTDKYFRSQKDWLQHNYHPKNPNEKIYTIPTTTEDWLMINHGQAEIHMMALAEAMWDALNESTPQVLRPGQWHIPYEEMATNDMINEALGLGFPSYNPANWRKEDAILLEYKIKISTAMCARESYTTLGDEKEFTIQKQIALHDKLVQSDPKHWSPTEHCSKAMTDDERNTYVKGKAEPLVNDKTLYYHKDESKGWCRNFKGFIQYREILENEQR